SASSISSSISGTSAAARISGSISGTMPDASPAAGFLSEVIQATSFRSYGPVADRMKPGLTPAPDQSGAGKMQDAGSAFAVVFGLIPAIIAAGGLIRCGKIGLHLVQNLLGTRATDFEIFGLDRIGGVHEGLTLFGGQDV